MWCVFNIMSMTTHFWTCCVLSHAGRKIDGSSFVDLSREDIALIFLGPDKFLLGMKLYNLVQTLRSDIDDINTQELLQNLDACGENLADACL